MNVAVLFIKTYLRVITVLATAVVLVSVFSILAFEENYGIPKAAIIDQLYDDVPNPGFHLTAIEYLETAGYDVDLYTTKDITVDFYKKLPSLDYEYIVIRSHSTAYYPKYASETLFTGEKYSHKKYTDEQLSGHIGQAAPFSMPQLKNMSEGRVSNQSYFVFGSTFVNEKMVGEFPGSVIVLAGCYTASTDRLSQSLIDRGASVVVGWDDTLPSTQNDTLILAFMEKMLVNGEVVPEALSSVTNDLRSYLNPLGLRYYPIGAI